MGELMSPRVVLGARPNPLPPLPPALGDAPIWDTVSPCMVGECPAWEYRHSLYARTLVIQSVADAAEGLHVYIAWVPSDDRTGPNGVFAQLAPVLQSLGILAGYWDCEEIDGALIPLVTDSRVLDAWPLAWRMRAPSDAPGDPMATPPTAPAAPSGARCIGAVIA